MYWNFAGYFDKSGVTGPLFTFVATAFPRYLSSPQRYFHFISVRRCRLTNPTKRYLSRFGKHFGGTSRRAGWIPWQVSCVTAPDDSYLCLCWAWMDDRRSTRPRPELSCTREVAKIITHIKSLSFFLAGNRRFFYERSYRFECTTASVSLDCSFVVFASGKLWYGAKRTRTTNYLYVDPVQSCFPVFAYLAFTITVWSGVDKNSFHLVLSKSCVRKWQCGCLIAKSLSDMRMLDVKMIAGFGEVFRFFLTPCDVQESFILALKFTAAVFFFLIRPVYVRIFRNRMVVYIYTPCRFSIIYFLYDSRFDFVLSESIGVDFR